MPRKSTDAITLLKSDHAKVKTLFKEFDRLHKAESEEEAGKVANKICMELKVHTAIEEEIFYPEVRAAIGEDDLMDEADVEHASAKDLIAQIESASPTDDKYAAKVTVLGEYIDHHVKEEHTEMFPKARKSELDMKELGARMLARKQDLMAELGMQDDSDGKPASAGRRSAAAAHPSRN